MRAIEAFETADISVVTGDLKPGIFVTLAALVAMLLIPICTCWILARTPTFAFTASEMMSLASSRKAVVCAPVAEDVVCVLPYRGYTSWRMNFSMDSTRRPLAVQSASIYRVSRSTHRGVHFGGEISSETGSWRRL